MPRVKQPRPRSHAADRWDAWQATPVSTRLLPLQARQEGYSVVRVPHDLRMTFLDVAQVMLLYDAVFQKRKQTLPPELLACFRIWAEATQALLVALQEEAHD